MAYTTRDVKGFEFEENEKFDKLMNTYNESRMDPKKGLFYLIDHLSDFKAFLHLFSSSGLEIKEYDHNNQSIEDIKNKEHFHAFVGDYKHYVVNNPNGQNIIKELFQLYLEKNFNV